MCVSDYLNIDVSIRSTKELASDMPCYKIHLQIYNIYIFSLLYRAFDLNSIFISPTFALVNRSILMLTH